MMGNVRRKRFSRRSRRPNFNRLTMNVEFAREFYDGHRPTNTRTLDRPQAGGHGEQLVPQGAQPGAAKPGSGPLGNVAGAAAAGPGQPGWGRPTPGARRDRLPDDIATERGHNDEPRDKAPGPMH